MASESIHQTRADFKAALKAGKPVVGAFISVPSPEFVEAAAYGGFDFVVIDAEHGPTGPGEMVHMIRAAQAAEVAALVRVPLVAKDYVLRALDAGATGILAPHICGAGEVRELVSECLYPPEGRRGAAFYARTHRFTRDSGWDVLERSNRELTIGVMIESREGAQHARDICQVPGLDFVLYGIHDMSVDVGKGEHNSAELEKAGLEIKSAAKEAGIACGIAASTVELARKRLESGFSMVAIGIVPLLVSAARRYTTGIHA
ncbi:HpcH/HpaI aldolase family protein [Candidimonas nitroreducens]|nr:aldolase/citrate lyase family protein [Candidimonas nitroreducens]